MKKLEKLRIKLYYKFLYAFLPRKKLIIPEELISKRNIFLYFDYERELSGHSTNIQDVDIENIINHLDKLDFYSTWFAVGEIFTKYPKSIDDILSHKHEIGSHTYNHFPPLHANKSLLKKDFGNFHTHAPNKIEGFHSPNGRWSLSLFKYLKKYQYSYDVISIPKSVSFRPFIHLIPGNKHIIRLQTTGDDWQLYHKNKDESEVYNHFVNLFQKVKIGEIAGIGFHPWVLKSDPRIMNGFLQFLDFLSLESNVNIKPAIYYVKKLQMKYD